MTRSTTFLAISTAVLICGAVGLIGLRRKPSIAAKNADLTLPLAVTATPESASRPTAASPSPEATRVTLPVAPAAVAQAPAALDEQSLMSTLRNLRGSDPSLTLKLAREGNQRFPDSPEVAERSWVIIKSLSDLGRHEEARVEGRILVERYRETRWGEDVYRHLFVNPPTHPFERGYGKGLELE